ncbi:unnamed protein product [Durusdinium trenchii]|uniref:Glycosyl transferase CAP10 domain-containing protein n=1 Tax=Durusdinium trenchii TaxID=1381693 RepID=A0ABP0L9C7_9DINO
MANSIAAFTAVLPATAAVPAAARCEAFGSDFYEQGFRDFEPFHELSSWDAQRVRNNCRVQGEACFVVQIKDGKMYVAEEQAGFQSRNHLTMAMLLRVSAKFFPLPDAEFVVDTSDGFSRIEAPLFVIAKFPSSRGGILYPDFSSYAWPESECPSEPFGSHVWSVAYSKLLDTAPPWHQKTEQLFWRGAATSAYRKQLVPQISQLQGANVSVMRWIVGQAGQRQVVSSGEKTCVPIEEWCQHRFLANLPGNTMALALKYRLLCGSVVMTSPLMYHEWYYSQLKDGEHYVALDLSWSSAADALAQLRSERVKLAEGIGARAREWARTHLTDDAFDCYWLHLIRMASQHFPPPQLTPSSRPVEALLAASAAGASAAATAQERRSSLDVIIVIPARAGDEALMDHARNTWLGEVQDSKLSTRHFFVISLRDPDVDGLRRAEDLLVVDCEHGYRQLMQKMAVAYRILLDRFVVRFFIRADVDSVLPLQYLLPLLPHASAGQSLVRVPDVSGCGGSPGHAARWKMPAVGRLQCQIECAMDRGCHFFQVILLFVWHALPFVWGLSVLCFLETFWLLAFLRKTHPWNVGNPSEIQFQDFALFWVLTGAHLACHKHPLSAGPVVGEVFVVRWAWYTWVTCVLFSCVFTSSFSIKFPL